MLYNKEWDKPTTPSAVMRRAADLIEEKGHTKGQLIDSNGSMCVNGALWNALGGFATPNRDLFLETTKILAKAIGIGMHPYWTQTYDLPGWNNAPERTGEEVIAKLREVANQNEAVLQTV